MLSPLTNQHRSLQLALWPLAWLRWSAICLACSPALLSAQAITPYDPTQPTPIEHLNSDLNGQGSFYLTPPPGPPTAARPANWAGGSRPGAAAGPGQSLDTDLGFTNDEAQQYARQLHEQAQRANRLGGPPAVPAPLYNDQLKSILASPYKLANDKIRAVTVVTDPRPLTPETPAEETYDAELVAYQAPIGQGPPPVQPAYGLPPAAPYQQPTSSVPPPQSPYGAPLEPSTQEFTDPSMIIARVDQEVVLLSDVMIVVNEELAKYAGKIPPEQMPEARRALTEMALRPVIEAKMVTADLKRKIPEEGVKRVTQKLGEIWEKEEYRKQLRAAKVESRRDLEMEYRRVGTTLDREKQAWIENELARQWMGQQIKFDEEVTHEQMLARYQADISEYEITAGVRWEELKANYTSSTRGDAWRRLAEAGNQVLSGVPFAEVAKRVSEGTTAAEGGARDWTGRGSLASRIIDEAIFSLPVGQLSSIIDDGQALYIVRVVERREAGVVPFTEAQAAIKKTIQRERIAEQSKSYIDKLYASSRVWTIFDQQKGLAGEPAPGARTASRPGP